MAGRGWLSAGIVGLLAAGCAAMPGAPDAGTKAALAPTGTLRVGLYTGNPLSLIEDRTSGERKGMAFELGRELAQRLGVEFQPVVYPSVGALLDASQASQWDVAFFLVNPQRAPGVDFTAPIVELELGYLVPAGSQVAAFAEIDRPGVRVAVTEKGQADVLLSRALKQATLVRAPGLAAMVERVKSGQANAIAANKTILHELSAQLPGGRILDGRFAAERLAMAIPKGRERGMAYAQKFVAEAKSQGLVAASMQRAGTRGAVVAP